MNDMVKTVTIETENGPVIINEADFKEGEHKLASGSVAPAPEPVQQTTPVQVQGGNGETLLVSKKGKKFFAVNKDGEPVERDGLEKGGYDSESDAWAAIMKLSGGNNA
ncbi:hypothetical protein P106B_15 [Rhizobium phage vB_RglS_P106B]|uniref:Uncharacterized protein n=1 Tax=Rhizobium phage vB_RglS_P106B TaxID=1458697 RepID=W6E9N0_9CAUD|nr:hypothetical protein P106B_15 [Rhizobium phage vB_RglS_P106B]AHJ10698.1 hypothetical protein P106B_15 [Rhizobium phage vB_RglS_P106B]